MTTLRIAAIRLLCPGPTATAAFYEAAFGSSFVLEFVRTSAHRSEPPPSISTGFQHCAIIVSDMEAAMARLHSVPGWTPISRDGPEHLPAASGGVTAFKFRDPDGHPLELLQFPRDAVPPAWAAQDELFLGIDHTAITVAETRRSIAYYAKLGFTVASQGLNRGVEQARMDDVDDPVVEVTGLMPPGGAPPHLELLCYRAPGPLLQTMASDEVFATRVILHDTGRAAFTETTDPDGHRLVIDREALHPSV